MIFNWTSVYLLDCYRSAGSRRASGKVSPFERGLRPEISCFCFGVLQVWFSNVPHTELASYKSDQNWVKVSGDKQKLVFPGGGTQFKTEGGALHYIEYIQKVSAFTAVHDLRIC